MFVLTIWYKIMLQLEQSTDKKGFQQRHRLLLNEFLAFFQMGHGEAEKTKINKFSSIS